MENHRAGKLLEIRDLRVSFDVEGRKARAVDGVDLDIRENEVFGLVGESGCGKSVTALSALRLIPSPPGKIESGQILFKGRDLLRASHQEIRNIRGNDISMIFQEPMTALNPVFSIGWQLREAVTRHQKGLRKKAARRRALELLELVEISDGERRLKEYPHQASGGMRQRVMIAMALAMKPSLLIADEPTTALDVTIQAQILDLMLELKEETGNTAVLLITHDLAVVAETCQRVAVMYGGRIQEVASAGDIFGKPLHPYTKGLLRSLPRPDRAGKERLETIPGIVPSIFDLPRGCRFAGRCPGRMPVCDRAEPDLVEVSPWRFCRCHLLSEGGSRREEKEKNSGRSNREGDRPRGEGEKP